MINFSENNSAAKKVAIYYAKKLSNSHMESLILGESDIASEEDAIALTRFFWAMSDLAAEDYENDVEVEGGIDLERSLEKIMNIFIGYLRKIGFFQQWVDESNKINNS